MLTHNPSRAAGLSRLARLSSELAEAGDELADKRDRFARLKDPGSAPVVVSSFNLFQTPPGLAERMAELLDIEPGMSVLEPSAGLGRLYVAARDQEPDAYFGLVDISPDCCNELRRISEGDGRTSVICHDFLSRVPASLGTFDRIIMNPPFKMGADILHIHHAIPFLKPGGRLVALCADGPKQNARLRPEIEGKGGTWETLPAGSFRSEGTNVDVALIVLDA